MTSSGLPVTHSGKALELWHLLACIVEVTEPAVGSRELGWVGRTSAFLNTSVLFHQPDGCSRAGAAGVGAYRYGGFL